MTCAQARALRLSEAVEDILMCVAYQGVTSVVPPLADVKIAG